MSHHTIYVTFVKRYKSNQKNFGAWCTPLTDDGTNSAEADRTKNVLFCCRNGSQGLFRLLMFVLSPAELR
ncbi:MAG: hypothetical protein IJN81_09655, partial [Clostridia bacterium]|nr:hypothetical protein [Clostridia bacterium]